MYCRHSSEELQNYVLDFITRVSQSYRKNYRSCDFITDILQLKVPNLFSSTSEPGADDMGLIEDRFSRFLQEYIRRNNLRPVIMKRIQEILVLVSEDRQTMFHWTVLNVLRLVSLYKYNIAEHVYIYTHVHVHSLLLKCPYLFSTHYVIVLIRK